MTEINVFHDGPWTLANDDLIVQNKRCGIGFPAMRTGDPGYKKYQRFAITWKNALEALL